MRYNFLLEMNQQGTLNTNPLLQSVHSAASFNSVFKPFQFGNLSTIRREALIQASRFKLNKISMLEKSLQDKLNSPETKTKSKIAIQAQMVQQAYKLHHQYTTKLIYWKSRTPLMMAPEIKQLTEQYSRQLFMLQQEFQRRSLNLNPANTANY